MATYTKKSNFADTFSYTEKTVAGLLSGNKIKLNVTNNDSGSSKNIVFAARTEAEVIDFLKSANASTTQKQTPIGSGLSYAGTGAGTQIVVDLTKFTDQLPSTTTSINSLKANDTVSATFWYAVKETNGTYSYAQSTLKITGVNDAAVIAGTKTASLTETNDVLLATGKLTVTDLDAGQAFFNTSTSPSQGKYGSFSISTDGTWSYSTSSAQDQFVQGVNYLDKFTVSTMDGTQSTVTITITGTNDTPVIDFDNKLIGQVTEDGVASTSTGSQVATGNIKATDLDGTSLTYTTDTPNTEFGYFSVASNGTWKYVLNNYKAQSLGINDSITETLNIKVSDAFGASSSESITITVTGANDAPIITSKSQPSYLTEDAPTKAGAAITATGQIMANDMDVGDTLSYILDGGVQSLDGVYGSLVINESTGKWTYTLDKENSQSLALGETVIEKFMVLVSDGNGGSVKDEIKINVSGTNDAPIIDVGSTSALGSILSGTDLSATGTIVATDIDHGAVLRYSADNSRGKYGSLVIDQDSGEWTYNLDERANTLGSGKTGTDTIAVIVRDEKGASVSTNVVINISGTNHAPVITSGPQSVNLNEDGENNGVLTATGQFTAVDVDKQNLYFNWTFDQNSSTQFVNQRPSYANAFGNVSFIGNQWKFIGVNNEIQKLAQGETLSQVWNVQASDGGSGLSNFETLTINITGANDAPVFENNFDAAVISKTQPVPAYGNFAFRDIDIHQDGTHDLLTVTTENNGLGQYGSLSIVETLNSKLQDGRGAYLWSYTLKDGFASSNEGMNLTAGRSLVERFVVQVNDGTTAISHEIFVTINGSNSGPVVTADSAVEQITDEDSTEIVQGQLNVQSDEGGVSYAIDLNDSGAYGTLSVDDSGRWSYVLDNSLTQFLAADEQIIDQAVIILTDSAGNASSVTIEVTITGSNDGPVIDRAAVATDTTISVAASDVDSVNQYLGVADADGFLAKLITPVPIENGADSTYMPTQQTDVLQGQVLVADNLDISLAATADAGLYLGLGAATGDTISSANATSKAALYGFAGNDVLTGSKFADVLAGGDGDDTLSGGAGNDKLYGGAGADALNGGLGKDIFVYASATDSIKSSMDTITGFGLLTSSTAATADKLDIFGTVTKAGATASIGVNGMDYGTIKSHFIDANSLIKFGTADAYSATRVTDSNLQDVFGYINQNLTTTGATVAFTGTSGGTTHTWVYASDGSSTSTNDFIVDLVGVTAEGVSTSAANNTLTKLVSIG